MIWKKSRLSVNRNDELIDDCPENDSNDEFLILNSRLSYDNDHFTTFPGPEFLPDDHIKPIEYFSIFFSYSFLTTMVTEINIYVEKLLSFRRIY